MRKDSQRVILFEEQNLLEKQKETFERLKIHRKNDLCRENYAALIIQRFLRSHHSKFASLYQSRSNYSSDTLQPQTSTNIPFATQTMELSSSVSSSPPLFALSHLETDSSALISTASLMPTPASSTLVCR
eukprot:Sdes_comp20195_c0_seq2m13486